MNGPSLKDHFLDSELLLDAPSEPYSAAAEDLALLIEDQRPALRAILQQFAIPPDDADVVLKQLIALAVLRWGELAHPATWLLATLRSLCLEHHLCAEPAGQVDSTAEVSELQLS